MRAHIGVVTWNRLELTRLCLESLLEKTPPGYTLTVVDNGSTDGTPRLLQAMAARHPHMRVHLLARNMGVAVASNLAWDDAAQADFFVKLDNDVEIRDALWLQRLMAMLAANPCLGMAGYALCPWHTGSPLPLADGLMAQETPCCNGACVCIPRGTHRELGFWNEAYGRYGYEDLEYSWRARRAGYRLAYAPHREAVVHHGSDPRRLDMEQEKIKLTSRTAELSGTKAYLLHLLLFEKGVLPLKMGRKYLPVRGAKGLSFALNPAHRPVQKLLARMAKSIDVNDAGELSRLDLRAWQGGEPPQHPERKTL